LIVALVPQYDDFGDSQGKFGGRDGGASTEEVMEDVMYISKMLPNKSTNAQVVSQHLGRTIWGLIVGSGSLHTAVIQHDVGKVRDLRCENEGNIFVEDGDHISPTLG